MIAEPVSLVAIAVSTKLQSKSHNRFFGWWLGLCNSELGKGYLDFIALDPLSIWHIILHLSNDLLVIDMPFMANDNVTQLSTFFWQSLKNGDTDLGYVEGIQRSFKFEGEECLLTSVQLGIPKPTINSLNLEEVVQLLWC